METKLKQELEEIIQKYGIEVLEQEKRMLSIFMDMYPKQKKELSGFKSLYSKGMMQGLIQSVHCGKTEQEKELLRARDVLAYTKKMSTEEVTEFLNALAGVLKFQYRLSEGQNRQIERPPITDIPRPKPIQETTNIDVDTGFTGISKKLCAVLVFFGILTVLGSLLQGSILEIVASVFCTGVLLYGAIHTPGPRIVHVGGLQKARRSVCLILAISFGVYLVAAVLPPGLGFLNQGIILLVLLFFCVYGARR